MAPVNRDGRGGFANSQVDATSVIAASSNNRQLPSEVNGKSAGGRGKQVP